MYRNKMFVFLKVAVVSLLLLLNNCSSVHNTNLIDNSIEANDPWEELNRGTFAFNLTFDKYILSPLAKGYRIILPAGVRKGVRNFLSNLSEPWTTINSALQGNINNTGNSVARFLLNTTIGLLGFIDVAKEFGFEKQKEDFGQTLAIHGAGTGPYLVIPFLGPSTVRDAMGKVVGFVGDPITIALKKNDNDEWIWIGTALQGLDFREQNLEKFDNLNATSVDFYATLRSLYLERRNRMIRNQGSDNQDPFQDYDLD